MSNISNKALGTNSGKINPRPSQEKSHVKRVQFSLFRVQENSKVAKDVELQNLLLTNIRTWLRRVDNRRACQATLAVLVRTSCKAEDSRKILRKNTLKVVCQRGVNQ